MRYVIDGVDTGIMHQDSGPWRSYELSAYGDTLEELLSDAGISEIDQDGGELDCYGLEEASPDVQKMAYKMIEDCVKDKAVSEYKTELVERITK